MGVTYKSTTKKICDAAGEDVYLQAFEDLRLTFRDFNFAVTKKIVVKKTFTTKNGNVAKLDCE